ncbi:hypothetical protein MTP10_09415 [Nonomuraea sp. 3-1Str]|uniref:YqeB family protein n=1 Tax=Nonomuraea sp. 3-1Str TaxID=2929801 RepID=UPI00286596F9|nr:hypothetical protein [Nonomuraea sp. 3-1Str]MDR8408957.1 hypothetical protein [Nonomuraea sp. 3-1Str]
MPSGAPSPPDATALPALGERVLIWVAFPLLGAGAGWLLRYVAGWAASLPWTPFEGPLRLVGSIPPTAFTIGAVALGAVAGLVLAVIADEYTVKVVVDDRQVAVAHRGSRREVPRGSIAAVFLDAKQLVLLGHDTEELVRQGGDLPRPGPLAAAFQAHGYPWREGDPHREEFRRWADGLPDLTDAAHAYFRARARALEKGDGEDAEQLRLELARLGVAVREENKRQFWRLTGRPPSG